MRSSFLLTVILLLASCATIDEGPVYRVNISTAPADNVTLSLNGQKIQDFSGTIELDKRQRDHYLTVSKPGYHPATYAFKRNIENVWFAKNLIWIVFPVAYIVDIANYSIYKFDPESLRIVLRKEG